MTERLLLPPFEMAVKTRDLVTTTANAWKAEYPIWMNPQTGSGGLHSMIGVNDASDREHVSSWMSLNVGAWFRALHNGDHRVEVVLEQAVVFSHGFVDKECGYSTFFLLAGVNCFGSWATFSSPGVLKWRTGIGTIINWASLHDGNFHDHKWQKPFWPKTVLTFDAPAKFTQARTGEPCHFQLSTILTQQGSCDDVSMLSDISTRLMVHEIRVSAVEAD